MWHVVLSKPQPGLSASARAAFVDSFGSAVAEVPSVRGIRFGKRLERGAGYEQAPPDGDYLAIVEFGDLAGLETYLGHPAHEELGVRFGESVASALVHDFEMLAHSERDVLPALQALLDEG